MFSWKEIYFTTDLAEFIRVRYLLEDQNIPTKMKIYSTRAKKSNMIVLGGYPFKLNTLEKVAPMEAYRILTKQDYVTNALTLISQQ